MPTPKLRGSVSYVVGILIAVMLTSGYFAVGAVKAELARDAKIVHFMCADMAYEDGWRADLHRLEKQLHRPVEDDASFVARDRKFTERELYAQTRAHACDVLQRDVTGL